MSANSTYLQLDIGREIHKFIKEYFMSVIVVFVVVLCLIQFFYVNYANNENDKKSRQTVITLSVTSFVGFLSLLGLYKGLPNLYDQEDLLKVAEAVSGQPKTSGNDALSYVIRRAMFTLKDGMKPNMIKNVGKLLSR